MAHHASSLESKAAPGLVAAVVAGSLAWIRASDDRVDFPEGPTYTERDELILPADYREWIYVSSGLGMTYGPEKAAERLPPRFNNVFVARSAYREFLKSGTWPDKTMFILEVRAADANVSINNGGRSQGKLLAIEASVKDVQRFRDAGWGYFSFDGPNGLVKTAAPLPASETCYSCHKAMAAVDNTFVQFYPTLFEVAKRLKTVRADYEPAGGP
jgi:hypothetical protein